MYPHHGGVRVEQAKALSIVGDMAENDRRGIGRGARVRTC